MKNYKTIFLQFLSYKQLLKSLCTLILVVCSYSAISQIEINSQVPTGYAEALHVGVGTAQFGLEIRNNNKQTIVQRIQFDQPSGLKIVSAEYILNGVTYPAGVSDNVIIINTILAPSQTMDVIYTKRATCAIVPIAVSGYSLQVIDGVTVYFDEGNKICNNKLISGFVSWITNKHSTVST